LRCFASLSMTDARLFKQKDKKKRAAVAALSFTLNVDTA